MDQSEPIGCYGSHFATSKSSLSIHQHYWKDDWLLMFLTKTEQWSNLPTEYYQESYSIGLFPKLLILNQV